MKTTAAPPPEDAIAKPNGSRLTVNYLLLTGGESLAKLATFIAFAYLARFLGLERYGSLEFVLATMMFFTLPVDSGLGVYGARELSQNPKRAADLLREVASLRLVLACVCFTLVTLLALCLPKDGQVKLLLVLYGMSLFAEPAILQWFFQGHDRMHWVALATLTRRVGFALLVLLLIRPSTPLPWIGVCECVSAVAMATVCLTVVRWRLGFRLPRLWNRFRVPFWAHLRQSAPIGLSELSWTLLWYIATVLLGLLARDEDLGWFGAAHRVFMALHTFVWLYFFNLLPFLSRSVVLSRGEVRDAVQQSLALTTWGGLAIALGFTLLGGEAIRWIYGGAFTPAGAVLAVLAWAIPLALLSGHYRYLLIAYSYQKIESYCAALAAGVALAVGLVLIPLYGGLGAASAVLAALLVNFGVVYVAAQRLVAPIPFHGQLALPGLTACAALLCYGSLARLGTWSAGSVALFVYALGFVVWAGQRLPLRSGSQLRLLTLGRTSR